MTRARGHLAAMIWNWSVKFGVKMSRRAFWDRIPARSGSGRDAGRRLGQSYNHMRPSGTRFIDNSRGLSKTLLKPLVQSRRMRESSMASSRRLLILRFANRLSSVSYTSSCTCATAVLQWMSRLFISVSRQQDLLLAGGGRVYPTQLSTRLPDGRFLTSQFLEPEVLAVQ